MPTTTFRLGDLVLRGFVVWVHTVTQGADGADAGIIAFVHQFGLLAYGDTLARIIVYSHDARLVQHYLTVLINDGVGGTEVDGQFLV